MHTNQTLNSLVIENPEFLPFSDEVKQYVAAYKWDEAIWNTLGLPAFNSSFVVTNKQIYFESDEDGNCSLRKLDDFTGQVIASIVLTPENCEDVFAVTFELTFCKGEWCDSRLLETNKGTRAEYDAGFKKFCEGNKRQFKTRKSWYFKYLYVPYYYVITALVWIVVFPVEMLLKLYMFLMLKLVPIKP